MYFVSNIHLDRAGCPLNIHVTESRAYFNASMEIYSNLTVVFTYQRLRLTCSKYLMVLKISCLRVNTFL